MDKSSRSQSEHLLKVLVIGEASTGKTSFIKRYVHQFYSKAYRATIGVDFALKTLQYGENTLVRLQLWDIAGQERFGSMTRVYYRDAVGAFLVYDVNQPRTFNAVLRWKNDLDSKVSLSDGSNIPCLLLANKCDLLQKTDKNEEAALMQFAEQNGFIGCLYTSPKNNINIDKAAKILVKEMMDRQQRLEKTDLKQSDTIIMTDPSSGRFDNSRGDSSNSGCCRSS